MFWGVGIAANQKSLIAYNANLKSDKNIPRTVYNIYLSPIHNISKWRHRRK